jgi:Flp pilus assembly pilin Flp
MLGILASTVRVLCADRRGVTALECSLIASLIAVMIITGVGMVGQGMSTMFGAISAEL